MNKHISDIPKGPPKPIPSAAAKPRNARLTLRQLITENDTKEYLISFLKEQGRTKKKGPWVDYLIFYQENQSGDVDSMSAPVKQKVDKLVKDLNDEYFRSQDL